VIRIVILDKGFVSVGVYAQGKDWCSLENAAVIRVWGTSRGLGQIAEEGPTSNTILDKTPKQSFPTHAVINTIECREEKWREVLGVTQVAKKKRAKS
jgi:hypothetical protein